MKKPKILLISDVPGWAWDYKCQQIKKYLSDEFDFTIIHRYQEGKLYRKQIGKHDLYFTFAPKFLDMLKPIPIHQRVSGVTAHYLGMDKDMNKYGNRLNGFMLIVSC